MKNIKYRCALLALIGFWSCASKELSPSDYRRYYAEHATQLSDHKISAGIDMSLTFQPLNVLVLNDLGDNMNAVQFEESKKNFNEHLYFTLDVVKSDPLSNVSGKELRAYFAHDRQRQFVLISKQDTLPCTLYHPELISRADKQVRVNLVFPNPSFAQAGNMLLEEDLRVRFYDEKTAQFVSFLINKDKVNQLPTIKI